MNAKKVIWMGDALRRLKCFPEAVQDAAGYGLHLIQMGEMPKSAKSLKGFRPAVMELALQLDGEAFRVIYTVKIASVVYVLHCFHKKSKCGVKTPKKEIDLVKKRLYEVTVLNEQWVGAHE